MHRVPWFERQLPPIDLAYFVAEPDDHHLARLRELTTTDGTRPQEL